MAGHETPSEPAAQDRITVLEVFGVKLSVRNRRLAEILTMDAAEALGLESRGAKTVDSEATREVVTEALPDVVAPVHSPQEEADARIRTELRHRADALGEALGFVTDSGGIWRSPAGLTLSTRIVPRVLSPAAAADMVGKLATLVLSRSPDTDSILLIAASREAVEPLSHAIQERGVYGSFRVASVADLERLHSLYELHRGDHVTALTFLAPQFAVDAGAMITLLTEGADIDG
jgi:hypothetical protein